MSTYLFMLRRDLISVKNPDLEIKRVIGTIHTTGEEEYIHAFRPKVLGYTVSQRSSDSLKIAYVGMPPVEFGWYMTTPDHRGITIVNTLLPTDESKINWDPLSQLENSIKCNIPEKIKEEFGIDICNYLFVNPAEDVKINIKQRFWCKFPENYFLGR